MAGKVAVITGANCGIGEATAVAVARMGATAVLACRNPTRADAAVARVRAASGSDRVEVVQLDLADLDSVRTAADEILKRFDRLDVLVNNAGGLSTERRTTSQGFEQTFGVNHLGPFLLTNLLLDQLRRSAPSRIVNVSSIGHRYARGMQWDDLQLEHGYNAFAAYAQSKLANILFTRALADRLPPAEVTANACHPGSVRTELGRDGDTTGFIGRMSFGVLRPFYLSAVRGARTQVYLASEPGMSGRTGGYYVRCREHQPSRAARDAAAAERLWDLSEQLVTAS
jgi:NAD(P)-dependent dehydrogenase (short-subunit alcohol dehydrogenase family)